jgi:hypothetical protein
MIVFGSLPSREMVVDQTSANTRNLVGADRGADSAAAHSHAPIHLSPRHRLRERNDKVGIVVLRVQSIRAEIHDFMPGRAELRRQLFLQGKTPVIRCHSDPHEYFLSV